MATYHLEFGKVGDSYPVPATTITAVDENEFARAVAKHAIPYLKPALEALGRPELADCFFRTTKDPTYGDFMWIDFMGNKAAHFCGTRITTT
jgi:hypothetical protein